MTSPSPNGTNGQRDTRGRFGPRNSGGPGNPYSKRTAELRAAMYAAIKPQDVAEIVTALIREAKKGNIQAAKEILERSVGRAIEAEVLERIHELERNVHKDQQL